MMKPDRTHSPARNKLLEVRAISTTMEFAIIVGLAFLFRLFVNAFVLGFDYRPDPDSVIYETLAQNVMQGSGYGVEEGRSYITPLYPLFLAAVYSIFGLHNYLALKIIESLIGAITCGAVYLTGRYLFGHSTGRLAGIFASIYPFLIYATAPVMTENLFTALLAVGIAFWAKLTRVFRWRYVLCAGIFLGLASLTRPVTILLPLVLIVWAILVYRQINRAFLLSGSVAVIIILVFLPWLVRNYTIHHQVLIASEDGITFWGSNNPLVAANPEKAGRWVMYTDLPNAQALAGLPELEKRQRAQALGWQFLRENPHKILPLAVMKQARFWSLYPNRSGLEKVMSLLSYGILFPFMLAGMLWSFLRSRSAALLLLGVISIFVAATFIYYGSTRMRLPIEPYLLLFAAYTIQQLLVIAARRLAKHPAFSYWFNESSSGIHS